MESNRLTEIMESFGTETQILHQNNLVRVESVNGNMAHVKYHPSGQCANVPINELVETTLPDDEDEYLSGINSRFSPLIRA